MIIICPIVIAYSMGQIIKSLLSSLLRLQFSLDFDETLQGSLEPTKYDGVH